MYDFIPIQATYRCETIAGKVVIEREWQIEYLEEIKRVALSLLRSDLAIAIALQAVERHLEGSGCSGDGNYDPNITSSLFGEVKECFDAMQSTVVASDLLAEGMDGDYMGDKEGAESTVYIAMSIIVKGGCAKQFKSRTYRYHVLFGAAVLMHQYMHLLRFNIAKKNGKTTANQRVVRSIDASGRRCRHEPSSGEDWSFERAFFGGRILARQAPTSNTDFVGQFESLQLQEISKDHSDVSRLDDEVVDSLSNGSTDLLPILSETGWEDNRRKLREAAERERRRFGPFARPQGRGCRVVYN